MNICIKRRWLTSLRYKLISSVLIMTLPLVGMLLYNNFYAIDVVREQVADSYKNTLTLYMNQIDTALNDVDAYMNTVAGGFDLLSLSQAVNDDNDYYTAKVYMSNKLKKDIALYDTLGSFFVYEGRRQDYMDISRTIGLTYEVKESIGRHVIELIENQQFRKGVATKMWQLYKIGQNYYLINIVQSGDAYLGGWVQIDQMLEPLGSLEIGEGGAILIANEEGKPITETHLIQDPGVELLKKSQSYHLTGSSKKYLTVGAPSTRGDFRLFALIPDQHILAKLPYLQWIIWIITFSSLLFIPIGLYSMRQTILLPLNRVLFTMRKVRDGDWSSRVVLNKASEEFQLLGESFNSMMKEIETLRVNVYEEQLNKQKEELQRLQLQVNPHFYLNTLNIVYNLAKVKNYDLIKEMALSLTHYFRFMFRSNTTFVKLKEELDHTRNYLRIQNLRFPGQLTSIIDAPDYINDVPIPPLIIQSFVENSIKHAVTMDKPITICIQIDYLDEETSSNMKIVKITIKDSGPGFSDQVLRELQAGRSMVNNQGEHTGIWNVERRLRLLYKETVRLQYYNDKEIGGAVVELLIPANSYRRKTYDISNTPC